MADGTGTAESVSEARLLDGLRNATDSSYEELVRQHGGWMLAVARRIVGPEAGPDCVQDAFVLAFQKVGAFEERSTLRTWLHRIVINASLQHLRKRRRRPEHSLDELMPVFDRYDCRIEPGRHQAASIESVLVRQEVRDQVRGAIDRLPDIYRTALILRDVEELDTADAAAALDITTVALKTRLHRARAALKALLTPILEEGDR